MMHTHADAARVSSPRMAAKTANASTAFHARYRLRPDHGGWADSAAADLATMPAGERTRWEEVFDHVAAAKLRPPAQDWAAAQIVAEQKCLWEPHEYDHEPLPLEPGSDAYREALLLTEWQGLTQDQMGKRLGLSPSGAKSRVQRARGQLKKLLLDCCRFELDQRGNILEMTPRRTKCRAG